MILKPNPHQQLFAPEFFIGLDLGKSRDFTVLALLERRWQIGAYCPQRVDHHRRPVLILRALVRVPLNTPYTSVPSLIKNLYSGYEAFYPVAADWKKGRWLVVDSGGVGAAVVDIIRAEQRTRYLKNIELVPVISTGAYHSGRLPNGTYTVPRLDLLSGLKTVIENRSLIIPQTLPLAPDFVAELAGFRATGESTSKHDDLAIATALAVWWATQQHKEMLAPQSPYFKGMALKLSQ